jgi:protein TonB
MTRVLRCLIVAASLSALRASAADQNLTGPQLIERARSVSGLQGGQSEFQARLQFKLFGIASVPVEGRMDYAWRPSGQWHREVSIPNYFREIDNSGENVVYKDRSADYEPLRLGQVYQLFSTVSNPWAWKEMKWGKVRSERGSLCATAAFRGIEEKWCFDSNGALTRWEFPSEKIEVGEFQTIGSRRVPTLLRYFHRNKLAVEAKATWDFQSHAGDEIFKPAEGAVDWPTCEDMVPPAPDHTPEPEYPRGMPGVTGDDASVLLYVTVAADGKIRMPYVIESGGAAFDQAAIIAVHEWTAHPATCGGKAIPAQMQVEVDFRYGRGGPSIPIYR